jgi:anti-sigma factor RsiW
MASGRPSDEQIQDYVDGRLGGRDLAAIAAYLLAHPGLAAEVETLRRQNEALKRIGEEILDEPVPERLRDVIRRLTGSEANDVKPGSGRLHLVALAGILLI